MNSSALQLFTFFIIWLFSYTVNADPAHCVANAGNPDAEIDVWLHYQSFEDFLYDESGTLGGLTVDEVIGALLQSMEEWNHSAAGTIFRYRGTTTSLVKGDCGFGVVRGGALNHLTVLTAPPPIFLLALGRVFLFKCPQLLIKFRDGG